MSQKSVESNERMSLLVVAEDKSLLLQAAALQHMNLTEFVVRTALASAKEIVSQSQRLALSERDSLRVMELLENPPEPNEKLMAAAFAMPKA